MLLLKQQTYQNVLITTIKTTKSEKIKQNKISWNIT